MGMKGDKRFDHDSKWSILGKIARKEFKATGGELIFETENVSAFLDLRPVARGHSLLVTKNKYATIMDMPPHIAAELLRELPRLARIVQKVTKADGISILSSNGDITGQSKYVSSASFHVIPWYENAGHDRNDIRYSAADTPLKAKSKVSFKIKSNPNVFEGTLQKAEKDKDGHDGWIIESPASECGSLKGENLKIKFPGHPVRVRRKDKNDAIQSGKAKTRKDGSWLVKFDDANEELVKPEAIFEFWADVKNISLVAPANGKNPIIHVYTGYRRIIEEKSINGQTMADAKKLLGELQGKDEELHPLAQRQAKTVTAK